MDSSWRMINPMYSLAIKFFNRDHPVWIQLTSDLIDRATGMYMTYKQFKSLIGLMKNVFQYGMDGNYEIEPYGSHSRLYIETDPCLGLVVSKTDPNGIYVEFTVPLDLCYDLSMPEAEGYKMLAILEEECINQDGGQQTACETGCIDTQPHEDIGSVPNQS